MCVPGGVAAVAPRVDRLRRSQLVELPGQRVIDHARLYEGRADALVLVADSTQPNWPSLTEESALAARPCLKPGRKLHFEGSDAGPLFGRGAGAGVEAVEGEATAVLKGTFHPVLLLYNKCDLDEADTEMTPEAFASHHRSAGSPPTPPTVPRSLRRPPCAPPH